MLQNLKEKQIETLVSGAVTAWYNDGKAIVSQGEEGSTFYVILRGKASVVVSNDNVAKTVAQIDAGGYFGERALLNKERRAASVIASGTVKAVCFTQAAFLEFAPHLKMQGDLAVRWERRLQVNACIFVVLVANSYTELSSRH